jgi:hypothetical protein
MMSRQADLLLKKLEINLGDFSSLTQNEAMQKPPMHRMPCSLATGTCQLCPSPNFSLRHPIAARAPIAGGWGSAQTPVYSMQRLGF